MEIDDGQVNKLEGHIVFLQKYIQKQGNLLLDQIRKSIENEIRSEGLTASLTEMSLKYEESQKQVDIQNDLMQQAANGVETLTIENKKLENTISNLEKMLSNKKNEYDELNKRLMDHRNESNACKEERETLKKELLELKSEYKTQNEELNILFKENEEFKKGKPKIKEASKSVDDF